MRTSKPNSWIFSMAASVTITVAFSGLLAGQTAAVKSSGGSTGSGTQWSVQVERIDPAQLDLAHSFQVAIYENLLEELNKTKRFKYVLREGDSKASDTPDLLILKTMVVKYTPGSETQRAVTTVSGATKLTVRSQLLTREGRIVLESTVNGNVLFFGSNLRATHNLARNIAKMIKQSACLGSDPLAGYSPVISESYGKTARPGPTLRTCDSGVIPPMVAVGAISAHIVVAAHHALPWTLPLLSPAC